MRLNLINPHDLSIPELQAEYLTRQLGVFLHFSMATFYDTDFPTSDKDPDSYNPTSLNMDQWVDSIVAADATYAVWTIKHADGWCQWPTATTSYNISNSAGYGDFGDLAQVFVTACRNQNIIPMFYFCALDTRFTAEHPGATQADHRSYLETQISELMSNYGALGGIWLDADNTGFFASQGYPWGSCAEANEFVQSRQNVLCVNNAYAELTTFSSPIVVFEGGSTARFVPDGNPYPAESAETCYSSGSPIRWFWNTSVPTLRSSSTHIDNLALAVSRGSNYLVNFPPDNTGLIENRMVTVMEEIGAR